MKTKLIYLARASALSAILTVSASAQELSLSAADGGRAQDRFRHLEPLSSCLAVTEAAHLDHGRVVHQAFVAFCDLEPNPEQKQQANKRKFLLFRFLRTKVQ